MKHLVIIGNSAAGMSAAFTAREKNKEIKITVISEEKRPGYRRDIICRVLGDQSRFSDLVVKPEQEYKEKNIELISGKKVEKVSTAKNWVVLSDKTRINYDALIIASGASMSLPKCVKGAQKHGILGLSSIGDVNNIMELIPISNTVCVWGAGLVGLKTALALKKKKLEVKIISEGDKMIPGLLDENGEQFIRNMLEVNDIELIEGQAIVEVFGEGDVKAIKLEKGKVIACDILVVNTYLQANTKFLSESGFEQNEIEQGLETDIFLNTRFDNVFAAGDVLKPADSRKFNFYDDPWAWQTAEKQGEIAGLNAVLFLDGKPEEKIVYHPDGLVVADIEVFNLPAVCIGITAKHSDEDGLEELSFVDEQFNAYRKIVISDSKIVGYMSIGDVEKHELFSRLIQAQTDISTLKDDLIDQDFDITLLEGLVN